jgi:hypothetical protein
MMFRTALFFLVIFVCMSAAVSFAIPLSDLDNKHNLSNQSNNTIKAQPLSTDGTDQICIFCHTPHSATPDSPLWSRPDPATNIFPIYGNPLVIGGGLDALTGGVSGQTSRSQYNTAALYPNGASRMCLSCHDGVTAIGLLNDGTTINMSGGATNLVGYNSTSPAIINLSTSHPISFIYDGDVLADLLGFTGPGYDAGSYVLPDGTVDTPLDGQSRMQCTTCHDPHDDTRDAIGLPFWRQTTGTPYDDVCNACHRAASFDPGLPAGDHQIPQL